jgi:hypothetical protein
MQWPTGCPSSMIKAYCSAWHGCASARTVRCGPCAAARRRRGERCAPNSVRATFSPAIRLGRRDRGPHGRMSPVAWWVGWWCSHALALYFFAGRGNGPTERHCPCHRALRILGRRRRRRCSGSAVAVPMLTCSYSKRGSSGGPDPAAASCFYSTVPSS